MHAPLDICKALYRTHPWARLAWEGRSPRYEGELNPGNFALIQLYHITDCGDRNDPFTYREYWDITTRMIDEWGARDRVRIDRGPIFAKDGSLKRDWNPEYRQPIFVMSFDGSWHDSEGVPLDTKAVFSGRIIPAIKEYMKPIVQRVQQSAQEVGKDLDREVSDFARDQADFLLFEANKASETRMPIAKKHITKEDWAMVNRARDGRVSLKDIHMPPKPEGVGQRHAKA